MQRFLILSFLLFSMITGCDKQQKNFNIHADFPGGNIKIDSIRGDTVWLQANQRNTDTTNEKWFYWYFAVDSKPGKTLTFIFNQEHIMATRGPAFSTDSGNTWKWMFQDSTDTNSFSYTFKQGKEHVRFSMGMPYTEKDFNAFIKPYKDNSLLTLDTLCITPQGRSTEQLVIENKKANPKYLVVFTARHHACEMMASYVIEGIIECLLSNSEVAQSILNNAKFVIIPFMDKDGVEEGDQGKHRIPHDHNRDYIKFLYCSTKSLKKKLPEWTQNKKIVAFDIHCPWIKYGWNEKIFMVGSEDSTFLQEQKIFANILEKEQKGELVFNKENIFPFGTGWNATTLSECIKKGKLSCKRFFSTIKPTIFATTIEFPYSDHSGQPITPQNSREFGKDIIRTLNIYLKKNKQQTEQTK